MRYKCDICDEEFKEIKDCKTHEENHRIEELKKSAPEGAIVCPTCKGAGWGTGTDGVDVRTCYRCNGKKYLKAVIQTTYVPID